MDTRQRRSHGRLGRFGVTRANRLMGCGPKAALKRAAAPSTQSARPRDPACSCVTFGSGNPKGIAAPEAANNAAAVGSFVPLMTLGVPGSGTRQQNAPPRREHCPTLRCARLGGRAA